MIHNVKECFTPKIWTKHGSPLITPIQQIIARTRKCNRGKTQKTCGLERNKNGLFVDNMIIRYSQEPQRNY